MGKTVTTIVICIRSTSKGFRQNIGTPKGRLGKIFGLFPYYDIYLQVLKLDGLAVILPTKPYLGV